MVCRSAVHQYPCSSENLNPRISRKRMIHFGRANPISMIGYADDIYTLPLRTFFGGGALSTPAGTSFYVAQLDFRSPRRGSPIHGGVSNYLRCCNQRVRVFRRDRGSAPDSRDRHRGRVPLLGSERSRCHVNSDHSDLRIA